MDPIFGLPDPRFRVAAGLLQPGLMGDYGNRPNGSKKGRGWLGILPRGDGGVSTELTAGVEIDGREAEIPLITPNLTYGEVLGLLRDENTPDEVYRKAYLWARGMGLLGKPPYAE
jgi:hypothetical protein